MLRQCVKRVWCGCCGQGGDGETDGNAPLNAILPKEWSTPYSFLAAVLADVKSVCGVDVVMFNAPAW